jgi:RNA polymerase sigma-70 factor, ECF subfamily
MEPHSATGVEGEAAELELLSLARARDGAAFEGLYRAHRGRVYALALRLTADPHEAEEAAQEAFIHAWRALPGFRGDSSFATWLHSLTVRVCLSLRRGARRRRVHLEAGADLDRFETEARRVLPETALGLERAVAALPLRARATLVLHDVYGYRYTEIAHLMGITLGTVKAQLHRARRLVMKEIEP